MRRGINLSRLKSFIDECGGIVWAARKLHVQPRTVAKLLHRQPISSVSRQKIETILGTATASISLGSSWPKKMTKRNLGITDSVVDSGLGLSEEPLIPEQVPDSLREQLRSLITEYGGIIRTAWKLNVRPSTLGKILAGRPISAVTRGKIELFLTKAPPTLCSDDKSEIPPKLREMIKDQVGVIEMASRLNLRPSTLQKILEGQPVSSGIREKIRAALGTSLDKPGDTRPSMIERLKEVYRLYCHFPQA